MTGVDNPFGTGQYTDLRAARVCGVGRGINQGMCAGY